jgi:thiol:disulfide interchange protein
MPGMTITVRATPVLLSGMLLLAACGGAQEPSRTGAAAPPAASQEAEEMAGEEMAGEEMAEEPESAPGAYVDYADFDADRAAYADSTVVLFFHAGWCPTCKQADRNLMADPAGIPTGLTVVQVDFDDADLRREYGVTQQHTFVTIGPDGSKRKVFTGALTAADIAERA